MQQVCSGELLLMIGSAMQVRLRAAEHDCQTTQILHCSLNSVHLELNMPDASEAL